MQFDYLQITAKNVIVAKDAFGKNYGEIFIGLADRCNGKKNGLPSPGILVAGSTTDTQKSGLPRNSQRSILAIVRIKQGENDFKKSFAW